MPILPKDNHCCGCSACYSACPHDSIAMIRDFEGFYIPQVDKSTCTECKSCEISCPTLPFLNFAPYNAVAKKSQFPLMAISAITRGGGNRYLDSACSVDF